MKARVAALLGVIALTGCGSGGMEEEWAGPPSPRADGSLPVAGFNDYLDEYPDYATSPEALTTEFLGLEDSDAAVTSMVTRQAEGSHTATVAATLAGLLDDSVEATRYELVVNRGDKGWRLESASQTVRCRPGRGHAGYSIERCV